MINTGNTSEFEPIDSIIKGNEISGGNSLTQVPAQNTIIRRNEPTVMGEHHNHYNLYNESEKMRYIF